MAAVTKENPFGIDPARDQAHWPVPPDVPLWNENCLFQGYDAIQGILFYHHLGRVADDQRQWAADFCLTLPDGRSLFSKTFGTVDDPRTMGDGVLTFDCLEPLREWRIRFNGTTFLTTREENRRRFSGFDQYPVPTEFDIVWEGIAPMYQTRRAGENTITSGYDVHYEQGGTFRGFLRYFDTVIPLGGTGYRDHSVGARDYSLFTGHVWTVAAFRESGRVFGTLNLDEGDRVASKTPYVVVDGELLDAEYLRGPYWGPGADDYDEKTFEVAFRAKGQEHVITAETLEASYYWTLFNPAQICAGVDPSRMIEEQHWVCKEVAVKYTWDGEETYGLLEISRRLGL